MSENDNTNEAAVELVGEASRTMSMNVPVDGVRAMLEALSGDIAMFPNFDDLDTIIIRVDHGAVFEAGA